MTMNTLFAYLLAAAVGISLVYVPDEIFYEQPDLFLSIYY